MSDINGHLLFVNEDGTTTFHPKDDIEACGFDEYVQRDWQNARPSRWEFIRRTDDSTGAVDWLGTRIDSPEGTP